MKITVTSTSTKLKNLLSPEDMGILRGKYIQDNGGGGGIGKNIGLNTIYVENGKTATTTESFPLAPEGVLSFGFRGDPFEVEFMTDSGESHFVILF